MTKQAKFFSVAILLAGDIVVLCITTVIGFVYHNSFSNSEQRLPLTLFTTVIAWLFVGFPLKVYYTNDRMTSHHLWRALWASILAAPMAAFLRGWVLDRPILPMFIIAFGGINTLAIMIWRSVYLIFNLMRKNNERR